MTTILESTDRTLHPGREKQAYVWNPEGWDPRDQLPGRLHEYADYARYFIHRIFWGRIANRSHAEGLVPLKSEYLRQVLTDYDTYNEVRRSLLDSGCMVTDNSYSIGRKAKGYGLGPRLRGRKHVRTPVTSPAVARQIFKQRRREFRPPQTDVHRYLHDWLSRLEIDRPGALASIEDSDPDGSLAASIHAIADGEFFWQVCPQGRCHTNLTNLKTELRRFLHYGGISLVNLDVRNSQPLLLSVLVLNCLRNEGFLESVHAFIGGSDLQEAHDLQKSELLGFSSLNPEKSQILQCNDLQKSELLGFSSLNPEKSQILQRNNLQKSELHGISPLDPGKPQIFQSSNVLPGASSSPTPPYTEGNFYSCTEDEIAHFNMPEDLRHYIQDTERGRFYDNLMEEAGIDQTYENRFLFKETFFRQTLFCKNNQEGKAAIPFGRKYPTVYGTIRDLKRRDHTLAARLLQKVESDLIINRVARRCMEELPDEAFVATIHDSILTTQGHAEATLAIMRECFAGVGLEPTINACEA